MCKQTLVNKKGKMKSRICKNKIEKRVYLEEMFLNIKNQTRSYAGAIKMCDFIFLNYEGLF